MLTTSEIILCLRVAIHSYMAGDRSNSGAALLSQFYGFFLDELTSRIEHYTSCHAFSSSSSSQKNLESEPMQHLQSSQKMFAAELVELLETIRNFSSGESLVVGAEGNKRFVLLEATILAYFDEVIFPAAGGQNGEVEKQSSEQSDDVEIDVQPWLNYFEARLEREMNDGDSNIQLIKALREGLMSAKRANSNGEAKTTSVSSPLPALAQTLKEVESFLTESSANRMIPSRIDFIHQISSADLSSKVEALLVARSLVALAIWHNKKEVDGGNTKTNVISGEERELLMDSVLVRHGFLVSQIQKFVVNEAGEDENTRMLVEVALPQAIAVLMMK